MSSVRFVLHKALAVRDFPGGPVMKTPRSHYREHGFDPKRHAG